jgi:Tol biopolymer transport system component
MLIAPGSIIGPYEVTAPLGEGGMGVVFRARDARLQRDVALKLLPAHFADDPDRLSRFRREAQLLASLNHAHIAQIYGLEEVDGSVCIVMELVEGETLADRLKKGPLAFDEALDISRQVADALAAAHERGIVHRDLKPANIRVMPNGTVKVLDFGLAKAMSARTSDINVSAMPTVVGGSIVGAVLGTPGYMSPEQARGREVDARTDIWAFGCVLYEMLTARQAFEGETVTDVMANIVAREPDLNLLPKETPSSIRLLLSSALNKNASQRLQHIGDTRLFFDGTFGAAASKADAPPGGRGIGIRGTFVMAALVVALAAAAVPAVLYFRSAAPTAPPQMRFEISFPGLFGTPALSPDGRAVAFVVQSADGRRTLWVRPIGADAAQQLAGTEDVSGMLWSPDSRRLAFLADGKLKKIDATGGSFQLLGDAGGVRGADWNRSGVILMARVSDNVIVRMSDSGGPMTPVTRLDPATKESLHALPVFLPDGNHFLYVAVAAKPEDSGIFLASLDSSQTPTRVVALQPNRFNGLAYASPGYLLIVNNGKLTAQHMDADGRTVRGDSVVLADDLDGGVTLSTTGVLMYRKAVPQAGKQLLWFDREGRQAGQVGAVANYGNVDLSPKGDRAAVDILTNNNRDIWVIDLARSVPSRITFDPGADWTASWSPDGGRLAFASSRAGDDNVTRTKIYEKSSTGAGTETVMPAGDVSAIPVHWSPDNKYIVFSRLKGKTPGSDTWLLPLSGDQKPMPLLESPFDKFQARVSPDGRFVAYSTNESGLYQVVVQTFPDANGGKWQISADGGIEPKWRRDGRELYFLAPDGKLMAVSIGGPVFTPGRPAVLFQTTLPMNRTQPLRDRRYDVGPDGRFLMVVPAASGAAMPTTVVVNWASALEK